MSSDENPKFKLSSSRTVPKYSSHHAHYVKYKELLGARLQIEDVLGERHKGLTDSEKKVYGLIKESGEAPTSNMPSENDGSEALILGNWWGFTWYSFNNSFASSGVRISCFGTSSCSKMLKERKQL